MQDPTSNSQISVTDTSRLDAGLGRFRNHPIIAKMREFLVSAPDKMLFHIDVDEVAHTWQTDRRTILELFLRGVRFGVLGMEWVFHCPTCGGVAKESLSLSHTREHDFCPVCRVDFQNTLDQNVEVFFSVGSEIRPLPSWLKEEYVAGMMADVADGGKHEWRSNSTVRGVEVLNHPVFREIFGDDTLSLDQSLEIASATVLFTDVTGSTELYESLGDARAYRLIRDHFDLVFEAVASHRGVPIKTIGDAVMGVFTSEASAIRAAFAMTDAIKQSNASRNDGRPLQLKVGVHRGPVIVVTLNSTIDYFGRTVNIASRVQSLAGPDELSMMKSVLLAPGVKPALLERVSRVSRSRAKLKGIEEIAEIYKVRLT